MARQKDLPGMESRKLPDLHDAAEAYVEARDRRIAASAPEIEANQEVIRLMKKHKKDRYECDDLLIEIVHEKESVKVRVKAADAEDDEDAA